MKNSYINNKKPSLKTGEDQVQKYMPITPATWETDQAGGWKVQGQPGQLSKTLSQNKK